MYLSQRATLLRAVIAQSLRRYPLKGYIPSSTCLADMILVFVINLFKTCCIVDKCYP